MNNEEHSKGYEIPQGVPEIYGKLLRIIRHKYPGNPGLLTGKIQTSVLQDVRIIDKVQPESLIFRIQNEESRVEIKPFYWMNGCSTWGWAEGGYSPTGWCERLGVLFFSLNNIHWLMIVMICFWLSILMVCQEDRDSFMPSRLERVFRMDMRNEIFSRKTEVISW